jgi:hypothetical protein
VVEDVAAAVARIPGGQGVEALLQGLDEEVGALLQPLVSGQIDQAAGRGE